MSPNSPHFILKDRVDFDIKTNTFHPTYLVMLGNVVATCLKGRLPHKVHFIITNMGASNKNFHIQEIALATYWRRKDKREAM